MTSRHQHHCSLSPKSFATCIVVLFIIVGSSITLWWRPSQQRIMDEHHVPTATRRRLLFDPKTVVVKKTTKSTSGGDAVSRKATTTSSVTGDTRPLPQSLSMVDFLNLPEPQDCIPRPPQLQALADQRAKEGKTLIYYHEGPNAGRHASFYEWFFPENAVYDCYDCDSTTDPLRQPEADVVVILYRKLVEYFKSNHHRIPQKYCGQLYVMVQTECSNNVDPKISPKRKYENTRVFDISSTFRLDSDLPRPYTPMVNFFLEQAKQNYVPVQERDSDYPVAWIASRCDTTNERMGYVEELMKHINIKSYGNCLHNADMKVNRKADNWLEAADAEIGHHKFYLAFENSNCDYYVTEKLYRTFKVGVIPVIMGAPQAELYVPNNHSAIFVKDYESPAALAKKLHEINNDDHLFQHYTSYVHDDSEVDAEFRNRWLRYRPPYACQLCDLVKGSLGLNSNNFRGVPYEHWESCEQKHGTWRTNFQPLTNLTDGIVPKLKITGH